MTYPIEQAKLRAAPDISVASVRQAVRAHGWLSLYSGVLRTGVPGVLTGALTFGVYETALRVLEV